MMKSKCSSLLRQRCDFEYALILGDLLKEEKKAQPKHKQQPEVDRLVQEWQMRLARRSAPVAISTLKVIEISSSDLD